MLCVCELFDWIFVCSASWSSQLNVYRVEAAWKLGQWDKMETYLKAVGFQMIVYIYWTNTAGTHVQHTVHVIFCYLEITLTVSLLDHKKRLVMLFSVTSKC